MRYEFWSSSALEEVVRTKGFRGHVLDSVRGVPHMAAQSQLVLHRGARPVTLEELAAVPAPPAEGRWRPQAHGAVATSVKETLGEFGYPVVREAHGLSRNDARYFGTIDLGTPMV